MSNYPNWILERAFGGTNVADTPGGTAGNLAWPKGRSAPGAEDCCQLLIKACNTSARLRKKVMVFLVGGAGNGKSFLAQHVTSSIEGRRLGTPDKFASRNYDYKLKNGAFFRAINDATIPPHGREGSGDFLTRDICETLEKGGYLLGCVNRGILVSEVNRRDADSQDPLYRLSCDLVAWLLTGNKPGQEGEIENQVHRISASSWSKNTDAGYYATCTLKAGSAEVADVHVVFMDQVSLLEPLPTVSEDNSDNGDHFLSAQPTTLLPLSKRLTTRHEPLSCCVVPLKEVLAKYFENVREQGTNEGWPGGQLDPVRANVQTLEKDDALNAFCSVLRASEILAGANISYRDAWGVAVLATTGAMRFSGKLEKHAADVADMAARVRDHTRYSCNQRLEAAVWLASRRYPVSLFSGRMPHAVMGAENQPDYPVVQTLEFLAMADPVKSLPTMVREKVKPKLMLLDEDAGPGAALALEDPRFGQVWTELEAALEVTLLEWLNQDDNAPSFSNRREVLFWYGQYLYRLYAAAHGLPAHYELVDQWQKIWNKVSKGHAPGDDISRGLRNLVFTPYGNASSETIFPIFTPRVAPVTDNDEGSRVGIGIQPAQYDWKYRCRGNSILVELRSPGDTVRGMELVIDFPMLREIEAKSDGQGFTEAANDVEPRIERVRAEVLSHASMPGGGAKPQIYFIDRGKRLR